MTLTTIASVEFTQTPQALPTASCSGFREYELRGGLAALQFELDN